jgi:pyruvate-formate lyase
MISACVADSIEESLKKDYRATFYERIQYLKESEPLFRDQPYAMRYGKTLEYLLERISVFLRPGERLIGSVREVIPDAEEIRQAEALSASWWDKAPETIQQDVLWFYSYGWLRRRPPWFTSFGHLALDWPALVDQGLGSFAERARAVAARPEMMADGTKSAFLAGALLCYEAIANFIRRYAREAAAAAELATDAARRAELRSIAASCLHISEGAPRDFAEALQLLWFVELVLMKVCGCGVFNLSRMDQYLLPLYERGLATGDLTRQEALALIEAFSAKNNEIMAPTDHMSQDAAGTQFTMEVTFDDPNYLTLGGLLAGDRPGVNALSFLFVEAAHHLCLRNPFIVVRYYHGIDPAFWRAVCAGMRDNATIVVYNDQTMLPALRTCGVEAADAYDYGFYGCNDPNIPAQEGGLRQLWFNLARPLELALNGGDYPMHPRGEQSAAETRYSVEDRMIGLMTGPYYGVSTALVESVRCMDDLLALYRQQVRALLQAYRQALEGDMAVEAVCNAGRFRIEDCFLQGTIEQAITWNNGGTKYHKVTVQGTGLATVADSLAAIDELVFQTQECTLPELVDILNRDFRGAERLQRRLHRKMPKFGNDREPVDSLARQVVDIFCDEVAGANTGEFLYTFFPTLSSDRDFTTMGRFVGATPDGRGAGQPLSENQSPSEGADGTGLTALLNSLAKLPFRRITGGPLNLRLHPTAVRGEDGLSAFAALLQTYMEKGGLQVQVNVVSRDELLDAQKHPDRYRTRCVRVTGYSAYFVQMGRTAQDELIRRTEIC